MNLEISSEFQPSNRPKFVPTLKSYTFSFCCQEILTPLFMSPLTTFYEIFSVHHKQFNIYKKYIPVTFCLRRIEKMQVTNDIEMISYRAVIVQGCLWKISLLRNKYTKGASPMAQQ